MAPCGKMKNLVTIVSDKYSTNKKCQQLKKNFNQITEGKTFINVCHEINSIFEYDKIIVIDKGNIIEMGSHEELIKKNNIYSKLSKMQNLS